MQSTAEIIWQGKEEPLVFLDSLKGAHLFFLEGMTNGMNRTFWLIILIVLCKLTVLHTWRQRMLRSNIQSCTPNGGRTLQIFMLMAYTRLGSCGEQQDKPGSRSCSLRYQSFLLHFLRLCPCPWLNSAFCKFSLDRGKTSWWLRTNLFCVHSSAQHWVSLLRGKSALFCGSNVEFYANHSQ